jgi:hypothetical protein
MGRTKQTLKRRAKTHRTQVLKLRKRKNKLKGSRRRAAGKSRKGKSIRRRK